MQHAHRAGELTSRRAHHHHLALDAAQVRQRVAGGEAAAVDGRAARAAGRRLPSTPKRSGTPLAASCPRQRGQRARAGRDGPPPGRTAPCGSGRRGRARAPPTPAGVRAIRSRVVRREKRGELGRGRGPARPRGCRGRAVPGWRSRPPGQRLDAEAHDRLLGALGLAPGRQHAAGVPGAGARAQPLAAVDDLDGNAALGERRGRRRGPRRRRRRCARERRSSRFSRRDGRSKALHARFLPARRSGAPAGGTGGRSLLSGSGCLHDRPYASVTWIRFEGSSRGALALVTSQPPAGAPLVVTGNLGAARACVKRGRGPVGPGKTRHLRPACGENDLRSAATGVR